MIKTAVMTDTNSGISVQEGEEMGIHVLPMPVIVDGKEYTEGVDITHEALFEALQSGKPAMTSQPSPGAVKALWDRALKEGAEEIVYIPMSSKLSGSCDAALALAEEYGGRVQVVDNHRISVTLRSSVMDALYLSRLGKTAAEIRTQLERNAFDASIYICVDTLKYLKRSNRVTAAGASLATAMNLHPILNIRGGKLDAQCVVRGDKHTQKTLIKLMETDLEKRFKFIPRSQMRMYTAGTFVNPEDAEEWTSKVRKAFKDEHIQYYPLSCSITCHVGENAVAIAMAIKGE